MSPTSLCPRGGGEVLADEVGDVVLASVGLGEPGPPRAWLAGLQVQLTHDAADELGTTRHAPPRELVMDASVAVGLVGSVECVGDEQREPFSPLGGRRCGPFLPVEESRRGHVEPGAHLLHGVCVLRVAGSARVDELVLLGYRGSRAKYAAAFFRNSFSIRSSRSSRCASASCIRSDAVKGGSSSACSSRYCFTQFPRVPSLTPSSRAT